MSSIGIAIAMSGFQLLVLSLRDFVGIGLPLDDGFEVISFMDDAESLGLTLVARFEDFGVPTGTAVTIS